MDMHLGLHCFMTDLTFPQAVNNIQAFTVVCERGLSPEIIRPVVY